MVASQINRVVDLETIEIQEKVMYSKQRYDLHKYCSQDDSRNQYSTRNQERKRMMEDQYGALMDMFKSPLNEKSSGE